jgi:hypothetical protein
MVQSTKTINNQNIRILITTKINKDIKRLEKAGIGQKYIEYVYYSVGNA